MPKGHKYAGYFKNLTEDQRNEVLHTKVKRLIKLNRIGLKEMAELFRDLNTQTKLNNQEHRQARVSDLASFIREVANDKKYKDAWRFHIKKGATKYDKSNHEALLAALALKLEKNLDTALK